MRPSRSPALRLVVKTEPPPAADDRRPSPDVQQKRQQRAIGRGRDSPYSQLQPCKPQQQQQQPQPPLIDISTPESLERDFYAWLKGDLDHFRSRHSSTASASVLSTAFALRPSPPPCSPRPPHDSKMFLPPLASSLASSDCARHQQQTTASADYVTLKPMHASNCKGLSASLPLRSQSVFHFKEEPTNLQSAAQSPSRSSSSSSSSSASSSLEGSPLQHQQRDMAEVEVIKTAAEASQQGQSTVGAAGSNNSRSSGVNQLGRTYSPGLPLSMAERQQIVELHRAGWKICDISKCLCVTHSCVSKILQRFRTTGSVRPKDAKEGRQESPLVAAIRDYRFRLGIVRQSDIREQLIRDGLCQRENAPSRSSINHILRTKLSVDYRKNDNENGAFLSNNEDRSV